MNTAIYTQSSGSEGVGFAMPSNIIASVYNMLISPDHKVIRGSIGISFQTASALRGQPRLRLRQRRRAWSIPSPPDGPAAKAGVKPGDVIVSIDGKPIKDGDRLVADISARKVGSTVAARHPAQRQPADPNGRHRRPRQAVRRQRQRMATTTPLRPSPTQAKASSASQVDAVPASTRQQARHPGRSHRHHRPARLLRRRDRPRQGHHHRRDQQEAGLRQVRFQFHRQRPEVRPGCGLQGARCKDRMPPPETPTSEAPCPNPWCRGRSARHPVLAPPRNQLRNP